jgi:histidinol-phosphate aminotransferase
VTDPSYRSMADLVVRGENVIVLRTASKIHGLAGCRIGFAIARPDIIERMQGFTTGVPNSLAARAAIAAIADTDWQTFCRTRNAEGREILRAAIAQLGRKQVTSHANVRCRRCSRRWPPRDSWWGARFRRTTTGCA